MQLLSHWQWWSNLSTQTSQMLQWRLRGKVITLQTGQISRGSNSSIRLMRVTDGSRFMTPGPSICIINARRIQRVKRAQTVVFIHYTFSPTSHGNTSAWRKNWQTIIVAKYPNIVLRERLILCKGCSRVKAPRIRYARLLLMSIVSSSRLTTVSWNSLSFIFSFAY